MGTGTAQAADVLKYTPWERGGIGRRSGLKIRLLRECGFESHRSYQEEKHCGKVGPSGSGMLRGLEPMRWNAVEKTAQCAVFRHSGGAL